MPPEGDMAANGGSSNSSDFVRKLYKMLEDPQYSSVVRWGDNGDSFVVLENDSFTKNILPKHFKHSNFASFVRQLNKYDFHKVRQNDDTGQSPYGAQAWEFKHPEFTIHSKQTLDNIRRKAPAPRKTQQHATEDPYAASQQVAILSETLNATQQQVQSLQELYFNISQANKVLVEEVVALKKSLKAQTQVSNEFMTFLSNLDEQRRNSRHSAHSSHSGQSSGFHNGTLSVLPDGNDEPSAELRRARDLLNSIEPDMTGDQAFHRLSVAYQTNSPPDSAASSSMVFTQPGSAVVSHPMIGNPFLDERHLVYPAGPNVGIDPFHPDHANNLPFALPLQPEASAQMTPPEKGKDEDLWGPRKPRVFLVEDDKTCSRIGSKFLTNIGCSVELAKDGEEATNKMNGDPERFDLIFMDIIMPNCDGVSATIYIRSVNARVPIIAMTSNIRSDEIASYYQWGMNDTLAKPFTKDGMAKILMKYCAHLLKNPANAGTGLDAPNGSVMPNAVPISGAGGVSNNPGYAAIPASMPGGAVKFETTPINSPATTGSWHSPSQSMAHASPNLEAGGYIPASNVAVSGPQMVMTPGGMANSAGGYAPQMGAPQIPPRMAASMSGDDRPEKRQRLYAPGGPAGYRQ